MVVSYLLIFVKDSLLSASLYKIISNSLIRLDFSLPCIKGNALSALTWSSWKRIPEQAMENGSSPVVCRLPLPEVAILPSLLVEKFVYTFLCIAGKMSWESLMDC